MDIPSRCSVQINVDDDAVRDTNIDSRSDGEMCEWFPPPVWMAKGWDSRHLNHGEQPKARQARHGARGIMQRRGGGKESKGSRAGTAGAWTRWNVPERKIT